MARPATVIRTPGARSDGRRVAPPTISAGHRRGRHGPVRPALTHAPQRVDRGQTDHDPAQADRVEQQRPGRRREPGAAQQRSRLRDRRRRVAGPCWVTVTARCSGAQPRQRRPGGPVAGDRRLARRPRRRTPPPAPARAPATAIARGDAGPGRRPACSGAASARAAHGAVSLRAPAPVVRARLRAPATHRHRAPAPRAVARAVVERPAAVVAGADLQSRPDPSAIATATIASTTPRAPAHARAGRRLEPQLPVGRDPHLHRGAPRRVVEPRWIADSVARPGAQALAQLRAPGCSESAPTGTSAVEQPVAGQPPRQRLGRVQQLGPVLALEVVVAVDERLHEGERVPARVDDLRAGDRWRATLSPLISVSRLAYGARARQGRVPILGRPDEEQRVA